VFAVGLCAAGLNRQTLTALGATGANHGASALGAHAHQKTMGTLAAHDGRLVCTFHESAFFTLAGLDCSFRPPAGAATEKPGIRAQIPFSVKNLDAAGTSRHTLSSCSPVRWFLCSIFRHGNIFIFFVSGAKVKTLSGRAS